MTSQTESNISAFRCVSASRGQWLPPLMLFVAGLVVWELICQTFDIKDYVMPAPTAIAKQISLNAGTLFKHTGITIFEAALGFGVANLLAFAFAVGFTYFSLFERSTYPYLVALQSVPIVALAPLITLWLGDGVSSKVAMAALITFFPMVVNATVGLKAVDRRALDLMWVLRASPVQVFFKVRVPGSLPYVVSALKISAPLSVVGAIVAEIAGAASGIGYLILVAAYKVETTYLFACVVFAAAAGLLFFGFALLLERKLVSNRTRVRARDDRDDNLTIMRLLRNGGVPSVELAESVSRGLRTIELKHLVRDDDESAILNWLDSTEPALIELACTLSSPLIKRGRHPRLVSKMNFLWDNPDYVIRRHVVWRLLDDPAIGDAMQRKILQFIEANWEQWWREGLQWNSKDEKGKMVAVHRKRMAAGSDTPDKKAWIYLIQASIDTDKSAVCDLVSPYVQSPHAFVAEVANRILINQGFFVKDTL